MRAGPSEWPHSLRKFHFRLWTAVSVLTSGGRESDREYLLSQTPNVLIKITYSTIDLHLENFQAKLKFLTVMSHAIPIRHIPVVGIIISILVIVPGPA